MATLAATVCWYGGSASLVLVLANDNSGRELYRRTVTEGEHFSVSYLHSVNKSPVEEIYRVVDGVILLESLEYRTFGVGMPTEPESGQTLTSLPGGGLRISGYNRPMQDFCYHIGYVANHTLHIQGEEIALDTLDQPGQPVRFSLRVPNRLQAFCARLISHISSQGGAVDDE